VLEELTASNLYRKTAQVFAVLLPVGTVGVMGDARTYDSVIAIRAVESQDFMTADWARIPFDVLATMGVPQIPCVAATVSTPPPRFLIDKCQTEKWNGWLDMCRPLA
jgi:GMP synthase (glutamine-hydrolysing)